MSDAGATTSGVGDERDDAVRLRELHAATRELMAAETPAAVASVAARTGSAVVGLDVNAVFFREGDLLAPAAATPAAHDLFGEIPSLRRGESMGWRVYDRGEAAVYDDVREADLMQNPQTRMRSELLLPLGDHGLFIAGTTTDAEFTSADVSLAKTFASNVEAALDRAEREARLGRQNERLDRFASVVSHDLRNPLNVAQGRLELARESCESDHLDHVERAHDRIEELLADLLDLARRGREVGETERVSVAAVVEAARSDVPASLDVTVEDVGHVDADRGRLRELFSNLLANAAEHGATSVRVGRLPAGRGFFVADDGTGVLEADRERVFERGFSTAEDGSGFGLAIVRDIARAHGWRVSLVESERGGVRIEVAVDPDGV